MIYLHHHDGLFENYQRGKRPHHWYSLVRATIMIPPQLVTGICLPRQAEGPALLLGLHLHQSVIRNQAWRLNLPDRQHQLTLIIAFSSRQMMIDNGMKRTRRKLQRTYSVGMRVWIRFVFPRHYISNRRADGKLKETLHRYPEDSESRMFNRDMEPESETVTAEDEMGIPPTQRISQV